MSEPSRDPADLVDEHKGSWYSAMVQCDVCLKEWAAVYPDVCTALECPGCGHFTRAPHLIEQDERDNPPEPDEPWR